ncbi:Pre-rRNA-processing protein TSR1 [Phytophthora megakarya]|uniref:Pre-rRNA-processing protein TSR1 n=1 Tax=Phytophthora megakarya TaxID=4795 RepID=A0A225X4G0_9STRA|nr:Pre-rRNA-processing protein TSR1 [Phytophthora megakarya]
MTSHHHRSGPLKQKNKKHKTGRHESKTLLARRSGGKVEGRRSSVRSTGSSIGSMSLSGQKAARLQRQKHLRDNKREELLLQRRFGLGGALGPPKIVALVGLSGSADLAAVQQSILDGASNVEEPAQDVVGLKNCTVGVFSQHKQKICVIDCGCNLLVALDAAKVADVVVFVLSVHNGADGGLSEEGVKIVSAVRAQGLPTTVGVIQGLEKHTAKGQTELKKLGSKFFATEFGEKFGESAKVALANVPGQLSRVLITLSPKVIHWREARSYMLATTATFVPGTEAQNDKGEQVGELQVNGYLRGKPLSVNQLIHITDVGTFQMSRITRAAARQVQRGKMDANMNAKPPVAPVTPGHDEELVLATADPTLQEDLRFEAEYDPFASEQTWPTNEEIEEAEAEAKKQRQEETAASKGASSYQAAWLDGDDEEEDEMKDADEEEDVAVNQDFCKTGEDDDDEDDDDMFMVDDAYVDQAQKRKDEEENMTFPDEVDAPADQPARVRFARYRGMKSLRTSAWDPKESLPSDYARLFQFDDFAMVQRLALARGKDAERAMKDQLRRMSKTQPTRSRASSMAMEDVEDSASAVSSSLASEALPDEFGEMGYVPSGVFVTLHLKSVCVAKLQSRIQAGPLVMGALLKHENRLSVLNFSVQRASSFAGETLKAKEELSFHCGFRRFSGKPVFSDQSLKSDQHLFQRFLPQSGWSVATVYGPVTFQPASLLLFKSDGQLVASGTLKNVNPDRVVLKRVIITGTPVKVKKRKAVVRYMFHSPEDIRWFKPVELVSKHGLTGHIKESLGTHGDLKAVFNKPIKQHDTVCLHLYKRVYPKFPTMNLLSN